MRGEVTYTGKRLTPLAGGADAYMDFTETYLQPLIGVDVQPHSACGFCLLDIRSQRARTTITKTRRR